jgi:hypothetical protein
MDPCTQAPRTIHSLHLEGHEALYDNYYNMVGHHDLATDWNQAKCYNLHSEDNLYDKFFLWLSPKEREE